MLKELAAGQLGLTLDLPPGIEVEADHQQASAWAACLGTAVPRRPRGEGKLGKGRIKSPDLHTGVSRTQQNADHERSSRPVIRRRARGLRRNLTSIADRARIRARTGYRYPAPDRGGTLVQLVKATARVSFSRGEGDSVQLQLVGRSGDVFHQFENTLDLGGTEVSSLVFPIDGATLEVSAVLPRADLDEDPAVLEWSTVKAKATGEVIRFGGRELALYDEWVVTRRTEATDRLKLRVVLLASGQVQSLSESPLVNVPGTVANASRPLTVPAL